MYIFIKVGFCFLLLSEAFSNYIELLSQIGQVSLKLHEYLTLKVNTNNENNQPKNSQG